MLQEGYMEGEDEVGGEEEAPKFDEEEEDWVHEYNSWPESWVPHDDKYEENHVEETHGRDYTLDQARFQRR
eukprot:2161570-Amphidinium_carterae.1